MRHDYASRLHRHFRHPTRWDEGYGATLDFGVPREQWILHA
jgi:hypothetical protein